MLSGLERLFRPKSIAVIGGLQAARVVEQCRLMGYQGEIWPVHPHKHEVEGLKTYRSVSELPGSPDAAFIGVNRKHCVDIVRDLKAKNCGGAICYASGFLEADETGARLQAELVNAAGSMPVLGPNCYGLINYADGALLWPDQQGGKRLNEGERGVAIIAQSSNIAINFTMQQRGLPLAFILTAGNQAMVGISELALTIIDDDRVSALGIYIEGFDSIDAMERLALKSRELNKPVVVYKVGKSEQSQIAAMTHTASLAGSHKSTQAFLKRYGFGQAESIPVFLETLKLLHIHGPLSGYRISSMSCSGGEASIIADAAADRQVYFPKLNEAQKAPIEVALGPLVTVANPLDYHTYCWGKQDIMQAAYSGMLALGFEMNYLILDFPHRQRCEDWEWMIAVDAFDTALKQNKATGAFVVGMPENISEDYAEAFNQRGIVSFYGIEEALSATEIAADIGAAWQLPMPAALLKLPVLTGKLKTFDEASAKQQLSQFGVSVPHNGRASSVQQCIELADSIGYPVVLKALGIAHKTEQAAVRLSLADAMQVNKAASDLFKLSDEIYCEVMLENSVAELIVGISRDSQFGLVLTIGSGGILVEILQDSLSLLLPCNRDQIRQAILSLKSAPLLEGYRARPRADIEAAVDAVMAIQDYALNQAENLVELDVNPLLINAIGEASFAADALIVLQEN